MKRGKEMLMSGGLKMRILVVRTRILGEGRVMLGFTLSKLR